MNLLIINCSPVKTGATSKITKIISERLSSTYKSKIICIDDYNVKFCRGCRTCHNTAKCVLNDDMPLIMDEFEWANVIISVSPSYWADIPGQFKAFIGRCTPWSNTHDPRAKISSGKNGYSVALRTGPSMKECDRIIETIEHFYSHLEIECCGKLGLCSIEDKEDIAKRKEEITAFCDKIL